MDGSNIRPAETPPTYPPIPTHTAKHTHRPAGNTDVSVNVQIQPSTRVDEAEIFWRRLLFGSAHFGG